MKHLRLFIWIVLLGLMVSPTFAALLSEECPALVQQALQATDQLCDGTGRNQACYGHARLDAQFHADGPSLTFDQPGDLVDVTAIQSLHLSPMEIATGNWGVALMRLQANLPASQPNDVTLLTFGDVKIQNAVKQPTRLTVVTGSDYVNVRLLPTVRAGVVESLAPNQTVTAVERVADNSWLRVEVPDSDITGWVNASLLVPQGDINTLNVAEPRQPYYRPMQAFYFESHDDQSACPEVPTSGLLIQTPEGVGEVKLLINEVNIQLGSTVFFETQPGNVLTVSTLEGHARVEALGVAHTAVAGTTVQVQLDETMKPASPPSLPASYDDTRLKNLPVGHLDRPVAVHPPLTGQELAEVIRSEQEAICCEQNEGNGNSPNNNCPGNSCENNPNRSGDNCPGNSCENNPNRSGDDCPGNSCDNGNKDKDKDKDKDK
ncbi:MAG: SH3 domain-containing protein [Chloroflexi bacterium]|nr:SH3 domain-containing protein [Chloroflexota bacterium]